MTINFNTTSTTPKNIYSILYLKSTAFSFLYVDRPVSINGHGKNELQGSLPKHLPDAITPQTAPQYCTIRGPNRKCVYCFYAMLEWLLFHDSNIALLII